MSWNWMSSLGLQTEDASQEGNSKVLQQANARNTLAVSHLCGSLSHATPDGSILGRSSKSMETEGPRRMLSSGTGGTPGNTNPNLFDSSFMQGKARSKDMEIWVTDMFEEMFHKIEASLQSVHRHFDERASQVEAKASTLEKQIRLMVVKCEDLEHLASEEASGLKLLRRKMDELQDEIASLRTSEASNVASPEPIIHRQVSQEFDMPASLGQTPTSIAKALESYVTAETLKEVLADVKETVQKLQVSQSIFCLKSADLTEEQRLGCLASLHKQEKSGTPRQQIPFGPSSSSSSLFVRSDIEDKVKKLDKEVRAFDTKLTQQIISQSLFTLRSAEMTPHQRFLCLEALQKQEAALLNQTSTSVTPNRSNTPTTENL